MGDFQYKSSSAGSWADVPKTAYYGTFVGTMTIVYPPASERDGTGRLCASVGNPRGEIDSALMTACGMDWWQSFFASATALDREFWLTLRNARTNVWERYTGWLERPAYSRVEIGSGSAAVRYYEVKIVIDDITAAA